jgi:hypothetical protein
MDAVRTKLHETFKNLFDLLADKETGSISKKSALAYLSLCMARGNCPLAQDNSQIDALVDLIFTEADLDCDGRITFAEAWEAFKSLSTQGLPSAFESMDTEQLQSLSQSVESYTQQLSLDAAAGGKCRWDEVKVLLKTALDALDTDQSGYLSESEIAVGIEHFFERKESMTGIRPYSTAAFHATHLFRLADLNHDGKIGADEFLNGCLVLFLSFPTKEFNNPADVLACSGFFEGKFKRINDFVDDSVDILVEDSSSDDEPGSHRVFPTISCAKVEEWLGDMRVSLFTQFKTVLASYVREIQGRRGKATTFIDPAAAQQVVHHREVYCILLFGSALIFLQ